MLSLPHRLLFGMASLLLQVESGGHDLVAQEIRAILRTSIQKDRAPQQSTQVARLTTFKNEEAEGYHHKVHADACVYIYTHTGR